MTETGQKRSLTIHFMDGSKLSVSFPQQLQDPTRMASMVERALESHQLAIDVSGELFVVPINNIKYLQLYPTPEKLPDLVIRGGTLEVEY